MHRLVELHGQPGWVAALTPFSVGWMIVAASTTLLADSRTGRRGGLLPWTLLVAGSVASVAANVAVAEPTLIGRVIAAWSLAHRASDGSLPSGSAIAAAHGRQKRWGRLVKEAGQAGTLGPTAMSQPTAPHGALGQTTATGAASAQ
jgi:hypothetical protein